MNSSKFRFTLDLHSIQSQYSIPVMVGDTGVTLLISITDGGIPYVITDGCLAKLSIKRPTGTYIEEFCEIKNNAIIEYPFSQNENTCAVEGIHHCDVTLYSPDGEKVGGPRFTMVVSEKVVRSDEVVLSDDDYTVVNAMIAKEAARQHSEELRTDAEERRNIAEAERVAAEKQRVEAENNRVKGELPIGGVHFENLGNDVVLSLYRGEYGASMARFNDRRLTNIEKGYSDDFFVTDDTNTLLKKVPSNAYPYAEVKKVYGATFMVDGVRTARAAKRIEVCKEKKATALDATLDLSDMASTMTVEKLGDGSFKFNGYTSEYGNGGARKFATVNLLPSGTYKLSYTIVSNLNMVYPSLFIYTEDGYAMIDNPHIFTTGGNGLALYIDIDIGNAGAAEDLVISFEMQKGTATNEGFTGELEAVDALVIPEAVRQMKGYGFGGNYVDFENKVLYVTREVENNAMVTIDPPRVTDISQYLEGGNLLAVEPNDYIRVIQYDDTAATIKTEISYMVKGVSG